MHPGESFPAFPKSYAQTDSSSLQICYDMLWTCTCVCTSWSCLYVLVVHRPCQHENVRISIHIRHIHAFPSKPFPITPFPKLKPHWSHKRHFVVATRPANGKPRNHHRGIVGNLYFLIFRHPNINNIIHLLKWIKYDRIAFRSFCPVSLNWWMNFPKLLKVSS